MKVTREVRIKYLERICALLSLSLETGSDAYFTMAESLRIDFKLKYGGVI